MEKTILVFKENLFGDIGLEIKKFLNTAKVLILIDHNVKKFYMRSILDSFESEDLNLLTFTIESDEQLKNLDTIRNIYMFMGQNKFSRNDTIIAIGGGIVSDIAGFVAATYMRGVNLILVPTTLLAQVDAAIGGKNAVNFGITNESNSVGYKNLIGSFYMPKAILIDPCVLKTLPENIFKQGIAEVIKYGAILDSNLFFYLLNSGFDRSMIFKCAKEKEIIVEKDFLDKGQRLILNFGHTIAHAIEKISNYKIPHGFAVSAGMCMITKITEENGITQSGTYDLLLNLVKKFSLPYEYKIPIREILKETYLDKKIDGDKINIVVLEKIGQAKIQKTSLDVFISGKGLL